MSTPTRERTGRARRLAAFAFAAAATLAAGPLAAAPPADAPLLNAARAAQPALVETLKAMVAIESGSADVEGLERMAALAEGRLRELGAATERVAPSQGKAPIVKAVFAGSGRARLMLMAHMDTVYAKGTLAVEPIRLEGNRLYGPGIADDKGGIAVILHALAILTEAGWRDYARLTVVFNADEEIGSIGSGEAIAALAAEQEFVFSFEPTAAKAVARNEALLLGAAGTATATLQVRGRASHAGAAPEQGRNALIELAYQLQQTKDVARDVPGAQLNWTTAQAGSVRNQIPDSATAGGDVRITVPGAAEKLRSALAAKLAGPKLVPDTETTLAIEVGRPPYLADDRAKALAARAQAIYAELDDRVLGLVPMTGGATDAGFAGRSGKAVVLESFGLAGWGYHAKSEYVELDSIVPRLYLLTRLLQTVTRP